MFVLPARGGHVASLAFTPDAAGLYACHGYSGTHAWNLADRTSAPVVIAGGPVLGAFALHPGGRWAFGYWGTAYTTPHLLDLPSGGARPFNFRHSRAVASTPDGSGVLAVGSSQFDADDRRAAGDRLYGWAMTAAGPARVWRREVPPHVGVTAVAALGPDRFATAETFNPDGRRQVAIRRTADGAPEAALDLPHPENQLLASPDGTKLVARLGTELRVWDATNWAMPPRVVEGKHKIDMEPPAACFHPSGDYLLLANGGPSVILYDARTWKELRKWNWKGGALRTVAASPDGMLAAAGGPRGVVVVWDLDL